MVIWKVKNDVRAEWLPQTREIKYEGQGWTRKRDQTKIGETSRTNNSN
jgi:hypothetical protein